MKKLNFIASFALLISVATVQPATPTMSSLIGSMYTGAVKAICNNPWTSAGIGLFATVIAAHSYAVLSSNRCYHLTAHKDGQTVKKSYLTEKSRKTDETKLQKDGYITHTSYWNFTPFGLGIASPSQNVFVDKNCTICCPPLG